MVIQSSGVAMGSGRTYQRQTRERRESGIATRASVRVQDVLAGVPTDNLFSSNRGWGEVLDSTTSPTARESKTVTKNETETEIVLVYQNYTSNGRKLANISDGTDPQDNPVRPLSVRELFSLLLKLRKDAFDRFLENYRIGVGIMREYRMKSTYTAEFSDGSVDDMSAEGSSYEYESELTDFGTSGKVTTTDGREIDFDVSLVLGRSYERRSEPRRLSKGGGLVDPLVINFGTGSTDLTDRTFEFDLDTDGELDNIAVLGQACGFLAYDKNEDGIINDGNELFGTKSGDGFEDLSVYDVDGNGWIDEADPIFDKLKIWSKDSSGNDQLVGLGVRGIGAIFLGRAPTEFSLKNLSNDTRGVIRSTGVFLREDGSAGTVQQVDFAKKNKIQLT